MFFSEVSKVFDRAFISSYFMPAALLVSIQALMLAFVIPANSVLARTAASYSNVVWATTIVITSVVLAVFLQFTNRTLIRVLEGYLFWPPFGRQRLRKKFRKWQSEKDTYERKRRSDGELSPEEMQRFRRLLLHLNSDYPGEERFVLPTRLGNVLRSYETYPRVYGIDSIPIWPMLLTVVSKDYLALVENAKSAFDFFDNSTVLLFVGGLELSVVSLFFGRYLFALLGLVFVLLAFFCYEGAVTSGRQRGDVVKSCFDVYRLELLKKLGYNLPTSLSEEQEIWGVLNTTYLYRSAPRVTYHQLPAGDATPVANPHS